MSTQLVPSRRHKLGSEGLSPPRVREELLLCPSGRETTSHKRVARFDVTVLVFGLGSWLSSLLDTVCEVSAITTS